MTRFSPTAVLRNGLRLLVPLSAVLTIYLYLYPIFNTCAFPLPPANGSAYGVDTGLGAFTETAKAHYARFADGESIPNGSSNSTIAQPPAPFRLLALGDPQLEGDTSIPNIAAGSFPHLKKIIDHVIFRSEHSSFRHRVRQALHDLVDFYLEDIPNELESYRKRIDLFGNDFYLAHQYRTLHWWTQPTHVTVLGDLLGSQWVDDKEFDKRAHRYWTRVFRNGERVPDELAKAPAEEYDLAGYLGGPHDNETEAWAKRIINVAGNHDIGYAGDINLERVDRFERAFGKVNYELRFELPVENASLVSTIYNAVNNRESDRLVPELRVVVLNDMNLDTPAASNDLQDDTYNFVNGIINTATAVEFKGHFTLVLTHIPMFKPDGVCADDPFFDFHDDGTLKEQNLLSEAASKGFLESILGMSGDSSAPGNGRGRPGIVLNGHDHVGCDTWHYINQTDGEKPEDRVWEVERWRQAKRHGIVGQEWAPGVREITVRSMMGDFGGNAGLLSLWFDEEEWQWRYEYATCALGTQHLWWIVHILDLIAAVAALLYLGVIVLSAVGLNVDKSIMGLFGAKGAEVRSASTFANGETKKTI